MVNSQQYQAEQAAAVATAVAAAGVAASMAGTSIVNFTVWMRLLRLIWPVVLQGRERAAWSSRAFFDAERFRVTGLARLDVPLLPEYRWEWFVKDMRPAFDLSVRQVRAVRELERQGLPAPAPKVESAVRVTAAKAVADAGRDQMIQAVEADVKNLRESRKEAKRLAVNLDDTREVFGWARVATGRETCAWCMMLVSRGPVYLDADTAGAKMTTTETLNAFDDGVVVPMDEWHTGCDCTVVPVWDRDDWPGKRAADDALDRWNEAAAYFDYDPDKLYRVRVDNPDGSYTFRRQTLTEGAARYRETLNSLRFMVEGRDPALRNKAAVDDVLAAYPDAAKLFKELARR